MKTKLILFLSVASVLASCVQSPCAPCSPDGEIGEPRSSSGAAEKAGPKKPSTWAMISEGFKPIGSDGGQIIPGLVTN